MLLCAGNKCGKSTFMQKKSCCVHVKKYPCIQFVISICCIVTSPSLSPKCLSHLYMYRFYLFSCVYMYLWSSPIEKVFVSRLRYHCVGKVDQGLKSCWLFLLYRENRFVLLHLTVNVKFITRVNHQNGKSYIRIHESCRQYLINSNVLLWVWSDIMSSERKS